VVVIKLLNYVPVPAQTHSENRETHSVPVYRVLLSVELGTGKLQLPKYNNYEQKFIIHSTSSLKKRSLVAHAITERL